jgi:hypothetical protein
MSLPLMLLLQAALPIERQADVDDFDLRTLVPEGPELELGLGRGCDRSDPDAIVVCGSRGEDSEYRFREVPNAYEEAPLVAETDLGGGMKGDMHLESATNPDGTTSKRIMVRVKVPF